MPVRAAEVRGRVRGAVVPPVLVQFEKLRSFEGLKPAPTSPRQPALFVLSHPCRGNAARRTGNAFCGRFWSWAVAEKLRVRLALASKAFSLPAFLCFPSLRPRSLWFHPSRWKPRLSIVPRESFESSLLTSASVNVGRFVCSFIRRGPLGSIGRRMDEPR